MILSLLFFSNFSQPHNFQNILKGLQKDGLKPVFLMTGANSVPAYCEHKSAKGRTGIAKTTGLTLSYINAPEKYMLA